MSASDALPIPRKNTAYRVYFPILKNDGSLITGWTSAAATLSKDGGTSASATNAPTEIASSWGIGCLDLTATEMNADAVIVKATVTNSSALPQVIVLYPQEAGDIRVNPTYWNDSAVATPDAAGYPKVTVKAGTGTGEIDLTSGQVKVASNNDKTNYQLADGAITAAKIATDAIGSAQLAASAVSEIVDAMDADSTQLARIAAKTDLIAADNVTTIAPLDPVSGDLTLVRGDDYTVSSGRALPTWSSDDWTVYDLLDAESVSFRARSRYSETVFETAAAVLSATSVRVELTSAETGAFAVGHDSYTFDLQATLATGDVVTLAQGHLSVLADVR
ncbi:MAG: hypothetical protein GC204_21455 [Chloroflexi bacterium]|nr:hypothetical protein [Chloroflexota bacterium]